MKKISILLMFSLSLFLISCIKVDINDDSVIKTGANNNQDLVVSGSNIKLDIDEEQLSSIKIKSTYSKEDIDSFVEKIKELELSNLEEFANMQQLARLYKYIGYPGKGIILYEKYLINNENSDAISNNLAKMYGRICAYEGKINTEYCDKAIENYQFIKDKYVGTYKDIAYIYIKMGNKTKAEETYELYIKNGGQRGTAIEKKIENMGN